MSIVYSIRKKIMDFANGERHQMNGTDEVLRSHSGQTDAYKCSSIKNHHVPHGYAEEKKSANDYSPAKDREKNEGHRSNHTSKIARGQERLIVLSYETGRASINFGQKND